MRIHRPIDDYVAGNPATREVLLLYGHRTLSAPHLDLSRAIQQLQEEELSGMMEPLPGVRASELSALRSIKQQCSVEETVS